MEALRYAKVSDRRSKFDDGLLITFRPGEGTSQTRLNVTACDRFLDIPVHTSIGLDHLEEDSPLAHLMMWDIVHVLPVGKSITVITDREECFFDRTYFREALHRMRHNGHLKFTKTASLLAERDKGLDRWSFGIPVGPDDATHLNLIVKRITDLQVPDFEIILCGEPGGNFRYRDRVRIVGEDITAPPVRIAAKKNRIAEAARYENLCILHDRVYLPLDFLSAVRSFGDLFPFQTMQAVYFDDLWCMVPRRYSDAGLLLRDRATLPAAMDRDGNVEHLTPFAPRLRPASDRYGYAARNALRYKAGYCYPTGSLYICKRAVWRFSPQKEDLHWTELEDVEHGLRSSDLGIPNVVNPNALAQSIVGRPLLSIKGGSVCEQAAGDCRWTRMPFYWAPTPRKPLFRVTLDQASRSFQAFAEEYSVPGMTRAFSDRKGSMRVYVTRLLYLIEASTVDLTAKNVSRFFQDVLRYLCFEQDLEPWRHAFVKDVYQRGRRAFRGLTDDSTWLRNIIWQRPVGKVFVSSPLDYLPKKSLLAELGIRLIGLSLWRWNGNTFFIKGNYRAICSMLRNSTPWREE